MAHCGLMPQTATRYFGSIEFEPADVIQFPSGLPAFEEENEFLILEPPANAPVVFLQSLRRPSLCFLALPIQAIAPDYHLAITAEDLEILALPTDRQPVPGSEVSCLAIVVVAENGRVSANLLAPIIVNRANRRALQAIRLDSCYSHQYAVAEDACL